MSTKTRVQYKKKQRSITAAAVDTLEKYSLIRAKTDTVAEQAKKKLEIDAIKRERDADTEAMGKATKVTLDNILLQCGLDWSMTQFLALSVLMGAAGFFLGIASGAGALLAGVAGLFFGYPVPRWIFRYIRARRFKAFSKGLPNALDSIVRNLKGGIPALEAIKILATESKEPIRSEFSIVVQEQAMGLTLGHAFERMAIRVPIEEARFLAIAVEIQAKSGGNLSEVLSNLAKVMRDRHRLKLKIKSMTSEARMGAYIVGGIPFAILGALSQLQPGHVDFFFTDSIGIFALSCSVLWQAIGVYIMFKMTNFKI